MTLSPFCRPVPPRRDGQGCAGVPSCSEFFFLKMSTNDLLVSGFVHGLMKQYSFVIPQDIITILILFYPQFMKFKGNTVELTNQEKDCGHEQELKIENKHNQ